MIFALVPLEDHAEKHVFPIMINVFDVMDVIDVMDKPAREK